jgi:hypothetical protein
MSAEAVDRARRVTEGLKGSEGMFSPLYAREKKEVVHELRNGYRLKQPLHSLLPFANGGKNGR